MKESPWGDSAEVNGHLSFGDMFKQARPSVRTAWTPHRSVRERPSAHTHSTACRQAVRRLHSCVGGTEGVCPALHCPALPCGLPCPVSGVLCGQVKMEDFSSALSKLSTPRWAARARPARRRARSTQTERCRRRELMIMMTELLARMEAHPKAEVERQDMDIAVQKALEQAV